MSLSPKHRKTIDAYMKGATKTDAMLAAGYSESTSKTRHQDVFGRPEVQTEIQRRQNLASVRSDITLDWIIQRLSPIADANVGDILDVYSDGSAKTNLLKLTPALRKAISKVSVDSYTEGRGKNSQEVKRIKIDFADKLKALELLARLLGLSKEKQSIEISGDRDMVEALQRGRSRVAMSPNGEKDV